VAYKYPKRKLAFEKLTIAAAAKRSTPSGTMTICVPGEVNSTNVCPAAFVNSDSRFRKSRKRQWALITNEYIIDAIAKYNQIS
jgi:hypothetical protein